MRNCAHSYNYHKGKSNAVPHGMLGENSSFMFSWHDISILTLPLLTINTIKSSQLFKTALLWIVRIYVYEYDVLALAYVRDNSGVCERETGQVCMCHCACVQVRGWPQVSIFTFYLFGGRGACLPIHCIGQSTRPSIPRGPPVFPWELWD